MPYLTSTDYPTVRERLGKVDATVLTDLMLQGAAIGLVSEAEINAALGGVTLTGDALAIARAAAIALYAYHSVPALQTLQKSEDIGDYSYTNYSPAEWKVLMDNLYASYESLLSSAMTVGNLNPVSENPHYFGVASPRC